MTKDKIFISLKDDLLFKEAFTHIDNRKILIYFLTAVTDFSYDYLINQNIKVNYESVLTKSKINDKNMRGDVLIEFDNYKINLEAYSYFNQASLEKSASYIMRIFSTQMDRGNHNYHLLESVIQINIVDNVKCNIGNAINTDFYLTGNNDPNIKLLANKFIMKIFRLDKAKEAEYNEDNLEVKWLKFIGAETEEERKSIAEGDELLMEFDNWIEEYVNDEKTKKIFGEWAEQIALDKGIEQGIEQGQELGAQAKALEIAKNMLKKDIPINTISEITNLSLDEINKLTNN